MPTPPRKRIASVVETKLLTLSRRRCCVCASLENDSGVKTDGQIAHVDRNRTNNELDNLVYLCLRHHDLYDTVRRQSKGITAQELKHYRGELYQNLGTDRHWLPPASLVEESQIQLGERIRQDCRDLDVPERTLINFILEEAGRHPLLFGSPFMSLPLVFRAYVLLLSWDLIEARAERLLNREQAYPANDAWSACLSEYRKATLLPYRTKPSGEQFSSSTETSRTITVYRTLISKTNDFVRTLREQNLNPPNVYSDLSTLIDEAEFALMNEDIGTSVARLEVVLSTIHKLILNCAPQGLGSAEITPSSLPTAYVQNYDRPNILIIDDQLEILETLRDLLEDEGYVVTTANTMGSGLRAMVDNEFDFVITDLVMPDGDGREVALAAKKSSSKIRVIVLTGYLQMSHVAHLREAGVEEIIGKADADLGSRLRNLFSKPNRGDQ